MQLYNWIYKPFNFIEGVIWLLYVPKTIFKYWRNSDKTIVLWQSGSFILFGVSDFIEIYLTTVLLILFKMSILISLILGHKAIILSKIKSAQQGNAPED